jgi:hypothetical protein
MHQILHAAFCSSDAILKVIAEWNMADKKLAHAHSRVRLTMQVSIVRLTLTVAFLVPFIS